MAGLNMSRTFFISDHHFSHAYIIKYENRPFQTVDEMDEEMIRIWNSIVKSDDKIFHLGDFALSNRKRIAEIARRLNGRICLIMGNHDKDQYYFYQKLFFRVYDHPIVYKDFWILSHKPLYMNESMPYVNIHGHIHGKCIEGKKFFNVSVERLNYKPISFEDLQGKLKE